MYLGLLLPISGPTARLCFILIFDMFHEPHRLVTYCSFCENGFHFGILYQTKANKITFKNKKWQESKIKSPKLKLLFILHLPQLNTAAVAL